MYASAASIDTPASAPPIRRPPQARRAPSVAIVVPTPFDPVNDLAPVGLVVQIPNVLAVHPSLPARSVSQFLALAGARPGAINYASTGSGTLPPPSTT